MVKSYVKNSHAPTHSHFALEVVNVFKVHREGEQARFEEVGAKIGNTTLLWHGSRTTNYVGILSQGAASAAPRTCLARHNPRAPAANFGTGLRIAPPEAPATGYMFGKGVYFADRVSKSANYCRTTPTHPMGLLLLCDVALGTPNEKVHADYNADRLPAGKHSTLGLGGNQPDPAATVTLPDGVKVPAGPTVQTAAGRSLLYNEFIVYDVAQIRMRYLVQTKFAYRSGW